MRVLDLTRLLPGPFATQVLGDLGADVVKVEEPKVGDYTRTWEGTEKLGQGASQASTLFLGINRNKRGVTLNLKSPEGVEIFKKLLPKFDVLVEQFRPGVMDRLGLGWETCRELNPRLVYCSITGFGATGPYRDKAGHDLNYVAYSGAGPLTGVPAGRNPGVELVGGCGVRPVVPGVQLADVAGGALYAVVGILAALASRERTGEGQFVDVGILDGTFSLLSHVVGDFLMAGGTSHVAGTHFLAQLHAAYDYYQCADGEWVAVGVLERKFWRNLVRAAARNGEERDRMLNLDFLAPQNQGEVRRWLTELFGSKPRSDWQFLFEDPEQCVTPVNGIRDAVNDPHLLARNMVVGMFTPAWGHFKVVGSPLKLSSTPVTYARPPPLKGEHNEEIYAEVGLSPGDVEDLKRRGVV
ncbi:MAG: CaiB/BaiF CoA-transferase family protein [Promethearchaeota archaeon]